jgi:solute carrier family 39 (zinc transporter), member 1/2/3
VGAILTSGSRGDSLRVPNVILQGFATGTLVFVIFCEVLKDRSGLIPFVSVLGGFLIMFGLQYIGE